MTTKKHRPNDLVQRPLIMHELLPDDLVEEILCRVPAMSLGRLRLTCKRWNNLVKDDLRFARKHLDKAPKQFLPFVLTNFYGLSSVKLNLCGLPSFEVRARGELTLFDSHSSAERFRIATVFHCDGLLLCTSRVKSTTVVVLNPCTGETKWIHHTDNLFINSGYHKLVLGYSQDKGSCHKSYKILSGGFRKGQVSKIYDFDSGSWRIVGDVTSGFTSRYDESSRGNVSLMGNAYWLAKRVISEYIIRFDFSKEKSERVPLSSHISSSLHKILCLSPLREEKLSLLLQHVHSLDTEVWVSDKIDELGATSWSKVFVVNLNIGALVRWGEILWVQEKNVVMCCDFWRDMKPFRNVSYITIENNQVTGIDNGGVETQDVSSLNVFNYVPSLARIQP